MRSADQTAPVARLDHVVINVLGRLDEAQEQYRKLGFQLTERGHHSLGSSNHLAIFQTDYLELLGYETGGETKRTDLWRHPPGLTGLVFKALAPDALVKHLGVRGVAIEPPAEFTRPVVLADGPHDARFRVVRLSEELVENGRAFFCHHYTPELVWRSEWQVHPNTVNGLAEFIIVSRDPDRTAAVYDRIFGPEFLSQVPGGLSFQAGAAQVTILDPGVFERRFGAPPPADERGGDRMAALVFKTGSLGSARDWLDSNAVPHWPYGEGGGLIVPASSAAGTALAFIA